MTKHPPHPGFRFMSFLIALVLARIGYSGKTHVQAHVVVSEGEDPGFNLRELRNQSEQSHLMLYEENYLICQVS